MQHSFPIGILVCFRKETIGELHEAIKNRDVEGDRRLEIRTLNFNGNFLSSMESCAINLSERRRRNRFAIDLDVALVQTTSEFRLDDRERFCG